MFEDESENGFDRVDDDAAPEEVCRECKETADSEDGVLFCCDCGHEWTSKQEYGQGMLEPELSESDIF